MLCKSPYMYGSMPCPCGQCMPCRINRRKLWAHRMLLETLKHDRSSFLTLTYSDDHLPRSGSLVPRDTQLWIKRFRKAIAPIPLRYYLVGEYGDETSRPHYHAALFGVGPEFESIVNLTWGKGHVMLGTLTAHSANYIAGYVTKKMTSKDDPRLNGRHPEFARMSNRPGIGATAMSDVADALFSQYGSDLFTESGDVPRSLRHGGKLMPLGRYLRRKLRDEIGMDQASEDAIKQRYALELQAVFKDDLLNPKIKKGDKVSSKSIYISKNRQKVRSLEARSKIYTKDKKL